MKIDFEGARLYVRPGPGEISFSAVAVMEQEHHVLFCPLLKLPSRMGLLLKIISDVFLKKPLMLKLKMTGKSFSLGILKLLHIRFVENGFKLWYNYVNVNLISRYG